MSLVQIPMSSKEDLFRRDARAAKTLVDSQRQLFSNPASRPEPDSSHLSVRQMVVAYSQCFEPISGVSVTGLELFCQGVLKSRSRETLRSCARLI